MTKRQGSVCLILLACLGFLVFSCATKSAAYKNIDQAVYQNEFEIGIETLVKKQESKKPMYSEKNAVLLYLDKGLLEHYAGRSSDSSKDLQEAERLIAEAYTKSITADVASYIANDNTKEYPGEDFEDIYLNVFNALNYYRAGNIEGALVEIRRLTESSGKLDMLGRKYEGTGPNAGEHMLAQLRKLGLSVNPQLPQGKSVNFSNSALARYLSVLFYLGEGKTDDARIEFEQLRAAFAANPNIYSNPFPKSAEDARTVPRGKARLNVIGFTGLSPIKEEGVFVSFFPFFRYLALQKSEFKLPKFIKRPSSIDRIEVAIEGGGAFNLELLEDMGAVMEETYNARFGNLFFKTYIRVLLKYTTAYITAAVVEEKQGAILANLSALAAKKTADATESADIRMSHYLPDKAYIGGINLDPGTYNVVINFYSRGSVVARKEYRDVNVKANTLNLVETINLK
ncbi:MAG: hypothetical protein LBB89_02300 [Treponema sp.]|jgi:hypothetical protein|nr:hypothetical protein [Treponema sp.]